MSITESTRVGISNTSYSRRFDDEVVVLDLGQGVYYALDEVGAMLWERLEKGDSVGEAATAVAGAYEVTREKALSDAVRLVGELVEKGLIVCKG